MLVIHVFFMIEILIWTVCTLNSTRFKYVLVINIKDVCFMCLPGDDMLAAPSCLLGLDFQFISVFAWSNHLNPRVSAFQLH